MYKILSLDGGGVWALAEVRALKTIYGDVTGHEVLGRFDLAVANSGGAIVLGGLAANRRLSAIEGLFTDPAARGQIFQPTTHLSSWFWRKILKVAPKYDTAAKLVALRALLPEIDQPLSGFSIPAQSAGTTVRLLVTAFDVDRQLAGFFRSQDVGGPGWGHGGAAHCTLVEAIHASSTPPVAYFDDPAIIGPTRLWDGGVAGYNNPVAAGVMEALAAGVDPEEIVVLTIGTGTKRLRGPPGTPGPYVAGLNDVGFPGGAISTLSGAILDDPPDVASFVAHGLIGGPPKAPPRPGLDTRVIRLSPMISPVPQGGTWVAPGGWTTQFDQLLNLQLDAIAPAEVTLIGQFVDLWLSGQAMNQPVRMQADALTVELGRGWFADAREDWRALTGD